MPGMQEAPAPQVNARDVSAGRAGPLLLRLHWRRVTGIGRAACHFTRLTHVRADVVCGCSFAAVPRMPWMSNSRLAYPLKGLVVVSGHSYIRSVVYCTSRGRICYVCLAHLFLFTCVKTFACCEISNFT